MGPEEDKSISTAMAKSAVNQIVNARIPIVQMDEHHPDQGFQVFFQPIRKPRSNENS
jgi:hypothetical protein